jgi:NADP-dependent alcohol dehydrogenase
MILYGGGSVLKHGTLAEVKAALADRYCVEFGGIEPNPTYETLLKAITLAREERIDFLLAVGGGSVIDGTKFVAAAIGHAGDCTELMTSKGKAIKQVTPFGVVLTLAATGSEMNNISVVTHLATQTKISISSPLLFPRFAVLDPRRTLTLPIRQVGNGVVDAFVHVVEQYLTYPADAAVQDRFSEGLLQVLIERGPSGLVRARQRDRACRPDVGGHHGAQWIDRGRRSSGLVYPSDRP